MKFIFTTLLIIFFIRLVAPVLFRWLLGVFIRKKMRNGNFFFGNMGQPQRNQEPQQHYTNGQKVKSNGNVHIDYIPDQPERKNFDGGEYVDYEEVK